MNYMQLLELSTMNVDNLIITVYYLLVHSSEKYDILYSRKLDVEEK